mgnify:CR=1 FL=1|jgi:hypothetical protein
MSIRNWLNTKWESILSGIKFYEEYPLATFNKLSLPILAEIGKLEGFELKDSKPYSVLSGDNLYHYVQTVKKRCSPSTHIMVTWRLQDDGHDPYMVVSIIKCIRFDTSKSGAGIGTIAIEGIYPSGIPDLVNYIKQVEDHSEEFQRIKILE